MLGSSRGAETSLPLEQDCDSREAFRSFLIMSFAFLESLLILSLQAVFKDFIEDGGQERVEFEGGLQGESSASCSRFPSE